jgi:thiosulfate reductase cytochrome b subunit
MALPHSRVVRVTHWVHAAGFIALAVSGGAILVAHPRLYWGWTGGVGTDSLIDLPLPFIFGPSGWGRSLHFLAAWVCVLNGAVYAAAGLGAMRLYEPMQRAAYRVVIFLLFPLVAITGLAMSPAITSVVPGLVGMFGGQESARTIHFFAACALVGFLALHVVMVFVSGFVEKMRGMLA